MWGAALDMGAVTTVTVKLAPLPGVGAATVLCSQTQKWSNTGSELFQNIYPFKKHLREPMTKFFAMLRVQK